MRRFRVEYSDRSITRDDIFDYVYGVLHSPHYRDRFANDLAKGLPRIPFAPDFRVFADAGAVLAELHLHYEDEDFPEHPLEVVPSAGHPLQPDDYRLGTRRMRFADEARTTLIVNDHVSLTGIPAEAHRYVVNGRTPLEWLMFYYKRATERRSGIVNDANGWFADPRDLVTTIQRIVYLSVETAKIVDGLPDPFKKRIMEGSSTPGSSAPATSRGKSPPRPSGGRTDRREPLRRCTPVELTRPLPSTVVRAPPKKGTSLKQAGGHGKKGTGSQAALVAKLKAEGLR